MYDHILGRRKLPSGVGSLLGEAFLSTWKLQRWVEYHQSRLESVFYILGKRARIAFLLALRGLAWLGMVRLA